MLLAADIDELQNEETFRTISESLEELFGSRVIAPYKLEIKCLSHFITLFLPLLTGYCHTHTYYSYAQFLHDLL